MAELVFFAKHLKAILRTFAACWQHSFHYAPRKLKIRVSLIVCVLPAGLLHAVSAPG